MSWLRAAIAVFAILHGVGHLTWFIGAWFPRAELVAAEPWLFSAGITITSTVGRFLGVLSLLAAAGFVAVGIGLLREATWWAPALWVSAAISLIVVVPWLRVSPGTTSINALLANAGLVAVAVVPAARQFAHLP